MGSINKHECLVRFCIVIAAVSLCYGDDGFICTRATYYGSPECLGNPKGACGFGEYGRTVNNGLVSGVSRLYGNGSRCGACYQVRCNIQGVCSQDGAKIVVTDYGEGHNTDFILSVNGYANLAASQSTAAQLFAYGVVDVEYRRIPCSHTGYNMMLKVHEGSSFPHYLAVLAIYQGGMYDITSVQLLVEENNEWVCMRRVFGAVWDMQNPPKGRGTNLYVRMQVTSGGGNDNSKWVDLPNVIPTYWKPGVAYDTGFQL